MKKAMKFAAIAVAVATLFASCVSTSQTDSSDASQKQTQGAKPSGQEKAVKEKPTKKRKFDAKAFTASYEKGDYVACAEMLFGKQIKKDLVKDMLDADMLMYYAKFYQAAGKGFLETYNQMQQNTATLNAGEATKAALSSETSTNYGGSEYERYLAWSMRLACALNLDQDDVANGIMKDYVGTFMREIQELREKNAQLDADAEKSLEGGEFKTAQSKLASSGINFSFIDRPKKSNVRYEGSPFFNYLGTLSYATSGDFDHAQEFASVYKVPNGKALASVPKGKGRLEVVALSGLIGRRADISAGVKPTCTMLPLPYVDRTIPIYTKIAYPVFDPAAQTHEIVGARVHLSNGQSAATYLIEDFDNAVAIDVAQKAWGAYSRSVFRNVVKNSIVVGSVIAAAIAVKETAGVSKIAAVAANIALNTAINVAAEAVAKIEKADIRQGVYFPHKASAAGFVLDPGTYTVKVEYLNSSNAVVGTKVIENVAVNAGKVTVRVSSCHK